jgi:hypothetical protein
VSALVDLSQKGVTMRKLLLTVAFVLTLTLSVFADDGNMGNPGLDGNMGNPGFVATIAQVIAPLMP